MFGRNCGSSCSSRTTWAMVPGPTKLGAVPSAAATRCKKSWRRETGTRGRAEEALASIERVRKKARAEAVKLTRSLGRNVDDSAFGLVAGVDEVLAGSGFMFSNLWLDDVLRRALNPSLPHMQNTDGEPLEFIAVHFQLVSNSNPLAIRAALDDLAPLRKEGDAFWNWVEEKALRRKFAKGQTQHPDLRHDDGRRRHRAWRRRTHGECGHVVGQLRKPGPLAGGHCWNRFSRGSCALPLLSGRPSNR